MDLRQIRDTYIDDGLDFQNATVRTCRDIVLALISTSTCDRLNTGEPALSLAIKATFKPKYSR